MRRMTQFLMALPVIAGLGLAALPSAQAQPGRWGGGGGAIAGALIGGLAVGALAGAAMSGGPGGYGYGYGYGPPPPPRAYMVPVAPMGPPPGYYYAAPGGYYSGW
ncbi:hypothetical protein GOB86_01725 [Acetobacter lambici]|nr:hypothetical protein [Acetobacter lambici]MCP1241011.1 hypothetical protein [Acetobacter lambici]NHO55807.1 hypothetical protein [Acetobacter lambici]